MDLTRTLRDTSKSAFFSSLKMSIFRVRPKRSQEEVTEVLFLCSDLSVLCLFSVWHLSVSCFLLSVRCSLSINRSQLSSARTNCIPKVGGLRSPIASMLARIIAYGAREVMFVHLMWENSSLLILTTCSVSDVKSPALNTLFRDLSDWYSLDFDMVVW